jgi:hypothetical protein
MLTKKACPTVMSAALASLFVTQGCVPPPEDEGAEPVESIGQDLYQLGTMWPGGHVPVCWERGGTIDVATNKVVGNADTLKADVRRYIENSWGRAARLRFSGWGTCGNTKGQVAIRWDSSLPFGQTDGFGYPGSGANRRIGISQFANDQQYRAIHEMGHALAIAHEQERPDNWDKNGHWIHCDQTDGNVKALPGGIYRSEDYDDESIMNYCSNAHDLSVLDIVGIQRMYGRKPAGTILGDQNKCLDIPLTGGDFTPSSTLQMQVYDCKGTTNQQFRRTSQSAIYAPGFPDKSYLDVANATTADQGRVQPNTLNRPSSANQRWAYEGVQVRGFGELCLDVPNGNFQSTQKVQLYPCNGGTNQQWSVSPDGRISSHNLCLDVPNGSNATFNELQIYACNGGANQKFTFTEAGELRFGGKCLDFNRDTGSVQLYTCKTEDNKTRMNQRWHLTGPIKGIGGQCLDIADGSASMAKVQTYHCTGNSNQTWDIYYK